MKSERWQQVEDLYHAASEKAAGERSAFLKTACAGDEELRGEVLSLLSRESFDALVDRPIAAVAAGLMNADERFGARRSVFGTESNVDRAGQGLLVYHAGAAGSQLMLVDRTGRSFGSQGEPGRYTDARISHDGQRLAVSRFDEDGQVMAHMWVFEFGRAIFSRFTFDRFARALSIS